MIRPATQKSTAQQIIDFASCLFEPDDIVEVRRLPSRRSTWHRASELADQAETFLADNAQDNIYVGANPRKTRGGRTDADVSIARTVFADFDNIIVKDAQEKWQDAGLPEPTLILNSGHGVHVYWRLSEPIDAVMFTRWQADLAVALGSDPVVKNPSRIMRLPGFTNHKKPITQCRVISADPRRVCELADLHECIPTADSEANERANVSESNPSPSGRVGLDVISRAAAYLNKTPGAVQGEHGDDHTFRVACALTNDFRLTADAAIPLIREWNRKCEPPWSDTDPR